MGEEGEGAAGGGGEGVASTMRWTTLNARMLPPSYSVICVTTPSLPPRSLRARTGASGAGGSVATTDSRGTSGGANSAASMMSQVKMTNAWVAADSHRTTI